MSIIDFVQFFASWQANNRFVQINLMPLCKHALGHASKWRTFIFELHSTFHRNMTTKTTMTRENPRNKNAILQLFGNMLFCETSRHALVEEFIEMTVKNLVVAKHYHCVFESLWPYFLLLSKKYCQLRHDNGLWELFLI